MNIRRIAVLLSKELWWGPKNFIFIMAVVVPVVLTLVVNLLAGTLFSGKPRLGMADLGQSELVAIGRETEGVLLYEYESAEALRKATAAGEVDMGLVLPANLDSQLQSEETAALTVYLWGESLLKDRALLGTAMAGMFHELAGQEPPLDIQTTILGEGESIAWEQRLLPLLVMMTIILGGSMIPATSLVEEKQKRTLTAVVTSAVSLEEVFIAKGLMGWLVSLSMGVFILILNRAFGTQPLLLVGLMALGALMAAAIGVLLGALVKDINTLFATIKGLGLVLYAPAFLYLFPSVPAWVSQLFPTHYMISPIMGLTLNGESWVDIRLDVAILVGLIAVLVGIIAVLSRRARSKPNLLPGLAG